MTSVTIAEEKILYKDVSFQIQGAFFEVYKAFGNSFKESIYHNALIEEFARRKLNTESNKRISVYYHGTKVGTYMPDLIVNDCIVIEIKCKPDFTQSDIQQFWHYLKGSSYKVGYLVNFGKPNEVQILRRVYDTARESSRDFA